MSKRSFPIWIVTFVLVTMMLQNVYSDVYMKQKQHSDALTIMGQTQPAQDLIVESWLTPGKMVVISKKQTIVMDLDKKVVTMANHEKKTIMSMPMDFSKLMDKKGPEMSAEDKEGHSHNIAVKIPNPPAIQRLVLHVF